MIRAACRWCLTAPVALVVACLVCLSAASAGAAERKVEAHKVVASVANRDITRVTGISVQGSDEFPKVLHIIPWRAPTLSRRARPKLKADMPDLLQAQEPDVLATQRHFRQTGRILSAPGSGS